jgi:hypothetical protein
MAQPESKLSRAIMSALRARGVWCFKVHGGPFTMAGVPDIIACVPVEMTTVSDPIEGGGLVNLGWRPTVGIFVGFETKTPTGGDPSPIQQRQHDKIRQACGHVYVPRSVQDAVDALEALGWCAPPTGPNRTSAWT